ncbi:MAG: archaeosortase/exosortase family protein [Candidatus Omnitrophica bacterium]|nr:archaeosortase/exosortase family protein [Candidatus Omnitrophota bacterium]
MPLKYVKIALIAVLSCTIFKPTFSWMVARFEETESFYAHGYLVPFVAAFLVFRLKDKLKAAEPRVYDKGLAMLVIFLCLHLLASFFEINFLSGLCFIGCLSALMLYNCGPAFLRVIAFPLFFLVFMVPAPNAIVFYVYGSEVAMGWFHDFSGLLVFVFAFIGFIILREIFISWRKKPIAS